ncbi:MAG: hypothetical protein KIT14_20020 [bacterium]|nr:hypothetical protein [bacterium]
MRSLLAAGLLAALATTAAAGLVPQQRGNACDAAWEIDGVDPAPGSRRRAAWIATCTDGDPFCDRDATTNGVCVVAVRACAQPSLEGCTATPVRRLRVPKATAARLPDLVLPDPRAGAACGAWSTLETVATEAGETGALVLDTRRRGRRGKSRVVMRCRPAGDRPLPCPQRAAGKPSRATLTWRGAGSDLDLGPSGEAHNFPFLEGRGLDLCLGACDGDATCRVRAIDAEQLSAPLPLLANGVPVCLNPRLAAVPDGTLDLAHGALALNVTLAADVHVLQGLGQVCPRCSGDGTVGSAGLCQGGPNQGKPCVVDALTTVPGTLGDPLYQLSQDCPPSGEPARTLDLPLVLSTGERRLDGSKPCPGQTMDDSCHGTGTCTVDCADTPAPKGGINQTCCSDNPILPCFPSAPDASGALARTGTPAALVPPDPALPRSGDGVLAHVGCMPRTTDSTVDILTGFPGPTAWLLPFRLTLQGAD